MRCRYCKIALAPSRSFVDGEFCCDDHRQRFESEDTPASEGRLASITKPVSAAFEMLRQKFASRPAEAEAEFTDQTGIQTEAELAAAPELAIASEEVERVDVPGESSDTR